MYEHSPYHIGSKLWETVPEIIQKLDNVYAFKSAVDKLHKVYNRDAIQECLKIRKSRMDISG